MAARRTSDPLRELERLVEVAGDDDHNLGELLFRESHVLGPALYLHETEISRLAAMPDGAVRARVVPALARLRAGSVHRRKDLVERGAHETALQLGRTAVFARGVHHLDVELLLSPELTGLPVTHVGFVTDAFTVPIARTKLIDIRRFLPRFPDLRTFVDVQGLHLRWHADRGRLIFYPQVRLHSDTALLVELPEARELVSIDTPTPPARPRSSRPFLWADVLSAVGDHL